MTQTRRTFLQTTSKFSFAAAGLLPTGMRALAGETETGLLHDAMVIAPQRGVQEVTTVNAPGGRYWMFLGEKGRLLRKDSGDGGRNWSKSVPQKTADGDSILLARDTPHLTLLKLKSGRLAIVYGGPVTRPGRDGTTLFRTSTDGGKTWSKATPVDPLFAVCRTQAARVLSTGRIVVPVMKWISPFTGGDSEGANKNLTFSWVYYSDDEGKTWKRSLSELFVSLDEGRRGVTHFEETVLEELPDGRLFMLGRTELGQFYKTYSSDKGVSWKHPVPTGLASSYAPGTLIRIPGTTDLMLVWNQVSEAEILTGLHRHRLSTAVSTDHRPKGQAPGDSHEEVRIQGTQSEGLSARSGMPENLLRNRGVFGPGSGRDLRLRVRRQGVREEIGHADQSAFPRLALRPRVSVP